MRVEVRMSRARWAALAAAVTAVLTLLGVYRVEQIHEYGWEWTLNPSAAPPKIDFDDHSYQRGIEEREIPTGWVRRGETMGGGDIFAPPGADPSPAMLRVRDGSRTWFYGRMGDKG